MPLFELIASQSSTQAILPMKQKPSNLLQLPGYKSPFLQPLKSRVYAPLPTFEADISVAVPRYLVEDWLRCSKKRSCEDTAQLHPGKRRRVRSEPTSSEHTNLLPRSQARHLSLETASQTRHLYLETDLHSRQFNFVTDSKATTSTRKSSRELLLEALETKYQLPNFVIPTYTPVLAPLTRPTIKNEL